MFSSYLPHSVPLSASTPLTCGLAQGLAHDRLAGQRPAFLRRQSEERILVLKEC